MARRLASLLIWLGGMASAPLASWALWRWLTRQPTSGCYGLLDGAPLERFVAMPIELVREALRDPTALLCVGPALLLPLSGLLLLGRRDGTRVALGLSALGYLALVLTSMGFISLGC